MFSGALPAAAEAGECIEHPLVVEEVAIALAGPNRKPASRRHRPELGKKAFAADDEAPILRDEVHRALEAAGRVWLQIGVLLGATLSIRLGSRIGLLRK